MEWAIHEVAKHAGTTSRTLRHYDKVGLLAPARVGHNGYRYYDKTALVKLQRILLLRELGLGLSDIADVLAKQTDVNSALAKHVTWLRAEKDRLDRQIGSVERTLTYLNDEGELTMTTMFDGFDHSQYEDEVRQNWGDKAWEDGNTWWNSLSADDKREFQDRVERINGALRRSAEAGHAADSAQFQQAVTDHHAWITEMWSSAPSREAYLNLAEMYVADDRFAKNYGGQENAQRIQEAITVWADNNM